MCVHGYLYINVVPMFLGPGTGTSGVKTSVGAQVIKTCDWNNYKHSPFHDHYM